MTAAIGYLCRCSKCGREERSRPDALTTGWPKCCGYGMTLVDNERFKEDIDRLVGEAFGPVREAMKRAGL